MKNAKKTALNIIEVIKAENVITYSNCLTRLRLNIDPNANIDIEKLKSLPNVMGVITPSNSEIQIVLGPGFVVQVKDEFAKLVENNNNSNYKSAAQVASEVKNDLKSKNNWLQTFFTKFSKIFSPMIIGFIGAGILAGIAGMIQSSYGIDFTNAEKIKLVSPTALSWFKFLNLLLDIWKNAFIIIVGWRTAEIFGGSGVLGAILATMYSPVFAGSVISIFTVNADQSINFLGIKIVNPEYNWLTVGFRPVFKNGVWVLGYPSGNIIGVLLTATASIWVEKLIRKAMPGFLDTVLTPTFTLIILLFINFFLLIPVSGYLYSIVAWFFSHLYSNPAGAFVLSGIFLMTVTFGIHQGFVPIYAMLVETTGVNGLFAILAMAGMAQVGTGIALWILSEKNSLLKKQIQGAIIPAIFGIGEPMIYGVTLPRIKPFITSCIAAAFGGFFVSLIGLIFNIKFGLNAMFGPSGILAAFMMTTADQKVGIAILLYLIGCIISVALGIVITLFAYSRVMTAGIIAVKKIYEPNGSYNLWQKILFTLCFITIIGFVIFIIVNYYSLSTDERKLYTANKVQ